MTFGEMIPMRCLCWWVAAAVLGGATTGCGGGMEEGIPADAFSKPPPMPRMRTMKAKMERTKAIMERTKAIMEKRSQQKKK